jgi:hypothetical protein
MFATTNDTDTVDNVMSSVGDIVGDEIGAEVLLVLLDAFSRRSGASDADPTSFKCRDGTSKASSNLLSLLNHSCIQSLSPTCRPAMALSSAEATESNKRLPEGNEKELTGWVAKRLQTPIGIEALESHATL